MIKKSPLIAIVYFTIFLSVIILSVFAFKQIHLDKLADTKERDKTEVAVTNSQATSTENSIQFTSTDLENSINKYLADQILNPVVTIDQTEITVKGKVVKLGKIDSIIKLRPEVKEGKICFKVSEIKAGVISVPGIIRDQIEKTVNKELDSQINAGNTITGFSLEQNKIIIKVKGK